MGVKPIKKKKIKVRNLKPWIFLGLMAAFAAVTYLLVADPFDIRSRANAKTNTIIVKFRPPVDERAIEALSNSASITHVEDIPVLGLKVMRISDNQVAEVVAERLSRHPLVEFAEPDDLIAPEVIPNDPQWGSSWHHSSIRTPLAWDNAKAENVLIGICDTGVNGDHEDLKDSMRGDLGWNAADGSNNWAPIAGHGTLVSGAAAATINNGLGVAGVAWGAKIIPIRITNSTDGLAQVSVAAKCIQYAADKGARAINLSYRMSGYSTIDTASQYALSKGAVVAVAGGNDNKLETWQDFPGFLAVSAITSTDTKASFSSYGNYVDIAAPGNNIRTTYSSGSYGGASGTSLAAPLVAGVAALVAGANPSLTGNQIQNILLNTAYDIGDPGEDIYFGKGKVDANRAVGEALGISGQLDNTPPEVVMTFPTEGGSVSPFTVALSANAIDAVGVEKVDFYIDGVKAGITDTVAPYTMNASTQNYPLGSTHTAYAIAHDTSGNRGTSSTVTFTILDNGDTILPTASFTTPSSGAVLSGDVKVTANMADNVGIYSGGFSLNTTSFGGFVQSLGTPTSKTHTSTLSTKSYSDGSYTLTVRVTDTNRNTFTTNIPVTINNGGAITSPTDTVATPTPTKAPTPTPTVATNDTIAPNTTITAPTNGATVKGNVRISASATDNVGVVKMEIYLDGALKSSSGGSSISTNWNTNAKNVASGQHNIQAKAYDAAGNVGTQTISVTK